MKTNYQLAIDGEIEPSLAYVELLAQQEEIAEKLAQLKPLVLQELNNYPEKEVKLYGLTFQKKSAAGRWDYSDIAQWNAYKEKIKELEGFAQQVYKSAEKGTQMNVADENGEIILPAKYTAGADTFSVLKK